MKNYFTKQNLITLRFKCPYLDKFWDFYDASSHQTSRRNPFWSLVRFRFNTVYKSEALERNTTQHTGVHPPYRDRFTKMWAHVDQVEASPIFSGHWARLNIRKDVLS